MQRIITIGYKLIRKILNFLIRKIHQATTWIMLYGNNVQFERFMTSGVPYVSVARGGKCIIGRNFRMNNGNRGNPIGRPQRCILFVDKGAILTIGENVGMSSTALIAQHRISIDKNVKIGGGVCIYDTDFHAIDSEIRSDYGKDFENRVCSPVHIKENAFIGAHATILKGVTIGKNSVIGACAVVTKSVPDNEIWAGNPAKFIKKL